LSDVEFFIFARFHALNGREAAVEAAIQDVLVPARQEPGCLSIHAFGSIQDPRLFYIHSHWRDEAAFETHARLPHTVSFIQRVEPLIDHALDVARVSLIG